MSKKSDRNLQLLGQKSAVWEKPGYQTNSQLTSTSRRLRQTSLHSPDNHRHAASQRHVTTSPQSAMEFSGKKSVTFTPPTYNGSSLVNGHNGEVSSTNSDLSTGSASGFSRPHSNWYTQPLQSRHIPAKTRSKSSRTTVAEKLASSAFSPVAPANDSRIPSDNIPPELEYFPVTLGADFALQSVRPDPPASPPPKALPKPDTTPWKQTQRSSGDRKRRHRPSSGHSSSSSASRGSVDRMYLMAAEAPAIGSSGTVLLSSPFQSELANLRLERLRIEEDHLLEVKRREELERIRGPQPKWYELKSPRFHYESRKNTEVLKSRESWQSLLDYRRELEAASKRYSEGATANGTATDTSHPV